jgi:hypothetical protein
LVEKDLEIINSIIFRIDLIISKFVYIPPEKNEDEEDFNNGNISPNNNLLLSDGDNPTNGNQDTRDEDVFNNKRKNKNRIILFEKNDRKV